MALYALGEALIDFVPSRSGKPADDMRYTPAVGGAPLNVVAAFAKLGGKSYILSQVGTDSFGELIAETAQSAGVSTEHLKRTQAAKTALAFVTLYDNGEREFSFYRDPSADMLYAPENLNALNPTPQDILHYCSVSLTPSPMREAHLVAIERFRQAGATISFDINVRLPLWKNPADLYTAIHEFLPYADIVKISDDELPFVCGHPIENTAQAIAALFRQNTRYIIYTCGANGASLYDKNGKRAHVDAYNVAALDATGAGDAFIGGLLAEAQQRGILTRSDWSDTDIHTLLRHAAAVGAITTLKRGAINSMPDRDRLNAFHQEQ